MNFHTVFFIYSLFYFTDKTASTLSEHSSVRPQCSARCEEPDMFKDSLDQIFSTHDMRNMHWNAHSDRIYRAYIVICKSIWCDKAFLEIFGPEGRTERSERLNVSAQGVQTQALHHTTVNSSFGMKYKLIWLIWFFGFWILVFLIKIEPNEEVTVKLHRLQLKNQLLK